MLVIDLLREKNQQYIEKMCVILPVIIKVVSDDVVKSKCNRILNFFEDFYEEGK